MECGCGIDAEGRVPDGSEGFAVDFDLGEFLYFAEVDPDLGSVLEPGGGGVDGLGVGADAAEVLDAGIGVCGPGGQLVKGDGRRCAAAGLEADGPGSGDSGEGG